MNSTFRHVTDRRTDGKIVAVKSGIAYIAVAPTVMQNGIRPGVGEIVFFNSSTKKLTSITAETNIALKQPVMWVCNSCNKLLTIKDKDSIYTTCSLCSESFPISEMVVTRHHGIICKEKCLVDIRKHIKKQDVESVTDYMEERIIAASGGRKNRIATSELTELFFDADFILES